MEYKIISVNNPELLSKEVNKHIAEGWELYGSLCVALGQGMIYAQAMIKGKPANEQHSSYLVMDSARRKE